MGKVVADISMSLDGFVAGPNDGLGQGLGEGGEPLHNWVMGGSWTHDEDPFGLPVFVLTSRAHEKRTAGRRRTRS